MQKRQCSDTENPSSTVSSSHIQKDIFNLLFQNNFIKGTQRNNVHVWISFYIWLTFFFQTLHAELWAASQILIKHTADCGQIFNKASWRRNEWKKRRKKSKPDFSISENTNIRLHRSILGRHFSAFLIQITNKDIRLISAGLLLLDLSTVSPHELNWQLQEKTSSMSRPQMHNVVVLWKGQGWQKKKRAREDEEDQQREKSKKIRKDKFLTRCILNRVAELISCFCFRPILLSHQSSSFGKL